MDKHRLGSPLVYLEERFRDIQFHTDHNDRRMYYVDNSKTMMIININIIGTVFLTIHLLIELNFHYQIRRHFLFFITFFKSEN